MEFTAKILPASCYRKPALNPEGIIVHYMSARYADTIGLDNSDFYDVDTCVEILKYYNVSAHVLIDRKGKPYQCVPFDKQANHAGASILNGRKHCNSWCLSVELLSTGLTNLDGEPPYTDEQYLTSKALLMAWRVQYGIPERNIAGHDEVRDNAIQAGLTTKKKYDPGPRFDWGRVL